MPFPLFRYRFTAIQDFCTIGTKALYYQYKAFVLAVQDTCTTAIPFLPSSYQILLRNQTGERCY